MMEIHGLRNEANHSTSNRTKLKSPPKVVEDDSGVGPSLSPSENFPNPVNSPLGR